MTPEERFWSKVEKTDGCWLWTGALNGGGYGRFNVGRRLYAHRAAYLMFVGPIPDGLQIDHLCRVRHCVNPDHLEPVTHAENVRRGEVGTRERMRTHCPHGHEYTEANTYVHPRDGSRKCMACARRRDQQRQPRDHINA